MIKKYSGVITKVIINSNIKLNLWLEEYYYENRS